jgi:GTPase SAR1 family protein
MGDVVFSAAVSTPTEIDDHLVKVVFVGSAGVGKTCLIRRLFSDKYCAETQPTIGAFCACARWEAKGETSG